MRVSQTLCALHVHGFMPLCLLKACFTGFFMVLTGKCLNRSVQGHVVFYNVFKGQFGPGVDRILPEVSASRLDHLMYFLAKVAMKPAHKKVPTIVSTIAAK